jgi:NAD(P)-dependent dehydrogenase (short-subunit alcohol dehydrogenase family)
VRERGRRLRSPLVPPTRTVLITGCSSPKGIGFATARALAERGHRVHATVRNHANDDRLRMGMEQTITVHTLDLVDSATINTVLAEVIDAEERLDVLINNAGYGLIGGIEQFGLDRVRENFEANFFGTMELIQRVLPIMRRQKGGHIVNVSTVFAAGLCPPAIGYYVASKAALESACQAAAVELAPWNVQVTNYQPGPVMTELSREWGDRLPAEEDPLPALSDDLYRWVASEDAPATQSPAEVGEALAELVEAPTAQLAEQSGAASRAYVSAALRDPSRAIELARLLAAFQRAAAS